MTSLTSARSAWLCALSTQLNIQHNKSYMKCTSSANNSREKLETLKPFHSKGKWADDNTVQQP